MERHHSIPIKGTTLDPCPYLPLPRMEFPTNVDNGTLLEALKPLANVLMYVRLCICLRGLWSSLNTESP